MSKHFVCLNIICFEIFVLGKLQDRVFLICRCNGTFWLGQHDFFAQSSQEFRLLRIPFECMDVLDLGEVGLVGDADGGRREPGQAAPPGGETKKTTEDGGSKDLLGSKRK